MKKMTYVEALNFAIDNLDNAEVVERLIALRDATAKRNSADKHPTKTQEANKGLKADILAFLADGSAHTATEIMGAVGIESNQKVSALLTQLKNDELVTRELIKRKAYFKIA